MFGFPEEKVFVDASNIMYHSFFSCWLKYVEFFNYDIAELQELGKSYDVAEDPEFCAMFKEKYIKTITDIATRYTTFFNWKNTYLCLDAPRNSTWRRMIYPGYKSGRDKKQKVNKTSYEGKWTGTYNFIDDVMLPELQFERGVNILRADHIEADDFVGVIVPTLDCKTLIITSDHDYIQLNRDNVTIVSPKGRVLSDEFPDAKRSLKEKIFAGDSSDSIPQVFPGHGASSKKKLPLICEQEGYLDSLWEKYPTAKRKVTNENGEKVNEEYNPREQFKLNARLISMDLIPPKVKDVILRKWEEVISE
jgi:5'-3' exonuclease